MHQALPLILVFAVAVPAADPVADADPVAGKGVSSDLATVRKEHAAELEVEIAALEKSINDVRRGRLREPGKSRREHLAELRGKLDPLKEELSQIDQWFPPLDLGTCRVGDVGRVAATMKVARVVDEGNVIGNFRTPNPADPKETLESPFWLTNVETRGMTVGKSVEIDAVFEIRTNDREGQLAVPELRRQEVPKSKIEK